MTVPFSNQENVQEFKELQLVPSDFEEIMEVLIARVKSRLPNKWQDFLTSNFGIELAEVFSYEASGGYEYFLQYIDPIDRTIF